MEPELQSIAHEAAVRHRLPEGLVKAIIEQESNGCPWAARFEPAFLDRYVAPRPAVFGAVSIGTERMLRATSFGPMQLMGQVARELGYKEPFLTKLCMPEEGIEYGCKKLASLMAKYSNTSDAIAAYNAGSPRRMKTGEYVNQAYVDSVEAKWSKY